MDQKPKTLFEKEMSRKEFLSLVGIGLVSVLGFGPLVKLLAGKSPHSTPQVHEGYGNSSYGGRGV